MNAARDRVERPVTRQEAQIQWDNHDQDPEVIAIANSVQYKSDNDGQLFMVDRDRNFAGPVSLSSSILHRGKRIPDVGFNEPGEGHNQENGSQILYRLQPDDRRRTTFAAARCRFLPSETISSG